jgi:hypothetical protein
MVKTQTALKKDVARAAEVGERLFPPEQAALIVDLIRRDLPYYDASISDSFVAGMNRFARGLGILTGDVPYEKVVAAQFCPLWTV